MRDGRSDVEVEVCNVDRRSGVVGDVENLEVGNNVNVQPKMGSSNIHDFLRDAVVAPQAGNILIQRWDSKVSVDNIND
jgi:hypothetical protein